MKMLNKKVAWFTGLVVAGIMASSSLVVAQAAEFIVPNDNGNVTVSADEQHKNLYVVGGNVLVNSNTTGDLYVAGGNVTVEGNVEGDLTIAGGTVYVNGTVGGDVRAIGGNLNLNDVVGGDVVAAGGTVILNEKATVGGDAIIAGGDISLLGAVVGQVRIHAERATINAPVTGNVEMNLTDKLSIGSKAVFGTNAKYKSVQEAQVEQGANLGNLQYEKMTSNEARKGEKAGFVAGILTLGFVLELLALIIGGLVLHKLFTRTADGMIQNTHNNFWMNTLIGLIAFIVGPILAILLMISIVGFYLALIVLVAWILFALVSGLIGTVYVGTWLVKKLGKKPELKVDWQAIVIGVVVMSIVKLIPVIGMLLVLLLMFVGMGTIVRKLQEVIKKEQVIETVEVQ